MLLYFHGGAFVLCRARTERMIVGNLAAWYLEAVVFWGSQGLGSRCWNKSILRPPCFHSSWYLMSKFGKETTWEERKNRIHRLDGSPILTKTVFFQNRFSENCLHIWPFDPTYFRCTTWLCHGAASSTCACDMGEEISTISTSTSSRHVNFDLFATNNTVNATNHLV